MKCAMALMPIAQAAISDLVFDKCLSKTETFGLPTDGAVVFDHQLFITENVDRDMTL